MIFFSIIVANFFPTDIGRFGEDKQFEVRGNGVRILSEYFIRFYLGGVGIKSRLTIFQT